MKPFSSSNRSRVFLCMKMEIHFTVKGGQRGKTCRGTKSKEERETKKRKTNKVLAPNMTHQQKILFSCPRVGTIPGYPVQNEKKENENVRAKHVWMSCLSRVQVRRQGLWTIDSRRKHLERERNKKDLHASEMKSFSFTSRLTRPKKMIKHPSSA